MDPVSILRSGNVRRWLPAILSFVFLFGGTGFAQEILVPAPRDIQEGEVDEVKPPLSPQYDKSHLWRIGGKVINSATGQPVPRALVMLGSAASLSAFTDARGGFSFDAIPQGPARISAAKPGFSAEGRGRRNAGVISRPTVLNVNADTDSLVISLNPFGAVYGRITGPDDEPVEDLPISLMRVGGSAGKLNRFAGRGGGSGEHQTVTDEDGHFRVANLEPGSYLLRMGPLSTFDEQDVAYPTAFYPGVEDKSMASKIEVGSGEQVELSFVAKPVQAFPVSGAVLGLPPAPSPGQGGVRVTIIDKQGEDVVGPQNIADPGGVFFFPSIPVGTYTIEAEPFLNRGERERLSASQLLTVSQALQPVQLALHPVRSVPVNIRTEFDRPQTRWEQLNIVSFPEDGNGNPEAQYLSQSGNGGEPKFSQTGPGSFRFYFGVGSTSIYVASARCGNVDLLTQPLTIPESGVPGPIDIVLRDSSGEVGISVEGDGDFVKIMLVPQAASVGQPLATQIPLTMGKGDFIFPAVPPGDYRAVAFDSAEIPDDSDTEMMDRLRSMGTPIQVAARSKSHIALHSVEIEP